MAGVWRHILRLPPGIAKKKVGQLGKRARAEVGALSAEHRSVHHFVVRELPRFGEPMPPQFIAESLGIPLAAVTTVLAELEAKRAFLFRNEEGEVVWAYPVTAEPTPHRIKFRSGETLYAA
jgi:hypothetical protein